MDSAVLHVVLPELILAVGAMALLMIGVFTPGAEKAGRAVSWLAIGVLRRRDGSGLRGHRNGERIRGCFRFRRPDAVPQNPHSRRGGADAADDIRRFRPRSPAAVRISRADAARGPRHADDGLRQTTSSLSISASSCKIWLSMSSRPSNAMTSGRAKRASNILF